MRDTQSLIDAMRRKARFFERTAGEGANETFLILRTAADALESERTRTDKAETALTNLEGGFRTFMRSHNQLLDELTETRAVIEQVRENLNPNPNGIPLKNLYAVRDILAAVEPQGDHENGSAQ